MSESGSGRGVERAAGRRLPRGVLWLAAAAAGFAVTGIEIALGRLLAPYFGSSLVVWAAIIASVIGALSLGYPLGGALADRHPAPGLPLAALLLGGLTGAALGIALPVWLPGAMAGVGLAGSAYWARLATVLALFALPCILLASVPPSVLRLTLRHPTTAGRDAGRLHALGSLGSVAGVLLPALWWIPLLGVRSTFLLLAAVASLPLALALALSPGWRAMRGATAALVGLGGLALLPAQVQLPAPAGSQVLYDRDSGFQRIRVVARDTPRHRRRWLQLSEGWATHSSFLEPHLVTGDIWDGMALTALLSKPDDGRTDVLIIGLAGGTVSNLMTRWLRPLLPGLAITGIELDPEVLAVADEWLGLDRSHLETIAADGRSWLADSDTRFDLILLDAYRQPSIPAHLATHEFFEDVAAHLTPGGLAVLNVFAPAGPSDLLDGLTATWSTVFPNGQVFSAPSADGFASRLLLGGPALPADFERVRTSTVPGVLRNAWLSLRARTGRLAPRGGVAPWTDDRSPVELLTDLSFRHHRPPNPPRAPQPARG